MSKHVPNEVISTSFGMDLTKTLSAVQKTSTAPQSINPLIRLILQYYGDSMSLITEKQIEKDRKILGFNFQRWLILLASLLVQLSLGSVYAWSVFNQPVDGYIYNNIHEDKAPLTYSILFCFSGIGACIIGPWLERHGPRPTLIIGTFFFVIGHFISVTGVYFKYILLVYCGHGLFTGTGTGICYLAVVATIQKWFPDYRGFASGFSVGGLGIGTVSYAKIALPVINLLGVPWTFVAYGVVHLILLSIGTFIIRTPPPDFTVKGMNSDGVPTAVAGQNQPVDQVEQTNTSAPTRIQYTLLEMLANREYRVIYWVFLANSIFNLVLASRLSNITIDVFKKDSSIASTAVSVLVDGAFSVLGRIIIPWISDFTGRKSTFMGIFTLQVTCITLMIIFIHYDSFWSYLIANWLVTSCFGGGFSVLTPMLAELFGSKSVSTGCGVIFLGWGIMGISGGLIFAAIYDHLIDSKQYTTADPMVYITNYYWLLSVCCTGVIVLYFLRMSVRDRLLLPVPGQLFRIRLGKRLLRVSTRRGIELLSSEDEEREWTAFWSTQTIPASGCVPAAIIKQIRNSAKNHEISNV
ncbi:major facilitator superfamily domain-containing protein [Syncephalis fuscata]|nr:major facilitator superfamily domain-containing protein [Syncephalis fuscata]